MEKMLIKSVAKDTNVARVMIVGVPDEPGIAFKIFSRVAKAHINVDIILQSVGRDGTKDITFTVPEDKGEDAVEASCANIVTWLGQRACRTIPTSLKFRWWAPGWKPTRALRPVCLRRSPMRTSISR